VSRKAGYRRKHDVSEKQNCCAGRPGNEMTVWRLLGHMLHGRRTRTLTKQGSIRNLSRLESRRVRVQGVSRTNTRNPLRTQFWWGGQLGMARSAVRPRSLSLRHTKISLIYISDRHVDLTVNSYGRPSINSRNPKSPFAPPHQNCVAS